MMTKAALRPAQRLGDLHTKLSSWPKVAAQLTAETGIAISGATVWRYATRGIAPQNPELQLALGIPQKIQNPLGVKACNCGQHFIPNVPWRAHCYTCSPRENPNAR